MNGYTGKILNVNLSEGTCTDEHLPDEIYYHYLSGTGLAALLLYLRIPAKADPLGPDNILAIMSGLLTGTGSLFTGRWMAAAKSPLTGTWGHANCGGNLAPAIKQCGYDGIFFYGISPEPVILHIAAKPQLLPARELWGSDAIRTEEILLSRAKTKKQPAIACIGPAGEKLSLISGICNHKGRFAARSGLGAVMGSKKIKAIMLEGSRPMGAADPEEMKRLSTFCARKASALPMPPQATLKWLGKLLGRLPVVPYNDGKLYTSLLAKWGTISLNQFSVEQGDSPIKNWKGTAKDYPASVSTHIAPDRIKEQEREKYHCYSCPLGCGGICRFKAKGTGSEKEMHKPEYESIMAFGGMLLNDDLDSIFEIVDMLNRAGMDTISAGSTVAFAMECFEKGLITQDDTGGLDLNWGNAASVKQLVEQMIRREGIGDILADGVRAAARKIGKGSEKFAITAGGQEMPMHDPRNDPGYGLHASVDAAPGKHSTGSLQYYEFYALWKKVKALPKAGLLNSTRGKFKHSGKTTQSMAANSCFTQFYNGAGLCMFGIFNGVHRVPIFEWMNAATGWKRSPEDYIETGRRLQTLKQLFNIKQGIKPIEMKAHPRSLGHPPMKNGPNKGRSVDIDRAIKDYWHAMGWNRQDGSPLPETVEALGLKDIIDGSIEDLFSSPPPIRPTPRRRPAKGKKPLIDYKICVSCTACVQECPVTCLVMENAQKKNPHLYPALPDRSTCISCAACRDICPVQAIAMG